MPDSSHAALSLSGLRDELLAIVASQDLDAIPDEFGATERFIVNSIRAVTRRSDILAMCAFVYSEAPRHDTSGLGFNRIVHIHDGYGTVSGNIVATNQDANNGMSRSCTLTSPEAIMGELEEAHLEKRCTVIWDPAKYVATIYPAGISSPDNHIRKTCKAGDEDLSQGEVRAALDDAYDENLKNPSTHTARLWSRLTLVDRAEDELERHLKGQLTMFFVGRQRPIKILSQTNTDVGRCDLIFLQRQAAGGPCIMGVLELKVLRGPESANWKDTKEGLSQGFYYREDLGLPFAILALFDVAISPSAILGEVVSGQSAEHLEVVLVIRYPIFKSPKAWRDSQV